MQQLKFALSLAQKAGKISSGDMGVEMSLRKNKVKLLIIAQNAAESTKKSLYSLAQNKSVPIYEIFSKDELGMMIGKAPRAALAILDKNFVVMVEKYMKKIEKRDNI